MLTNKQTNKIRVIAVLRLIDPIEEPKDKYRDEESNKFYVAKTRNKS